VRIAFVSIPRFPCAVEVLRRPELARRPLIVGDAEAPKRVLDCSHRAGDEHVRRGMTIRQALGECPEAIVVPPDPVLYRAKWESILDALGDLSPEVEGEEMGCAYVNISGLEARYRGEGALATQIIDTVRVASGLDASIGLSRGKFVAFAAATCSALGRGRVVLAGSEDIFLAPLDVRLLPVEPEVISRLRLFGLETIGEVGALSLPELQSQFGLAGRRLWQLAHGIDDQPLRPRRHSEPLQASLSLESPVAGIDMMIAIARQLLSRLQPSLSGRAARELTLQAELTSGRGWEHHVVFREPVSEAERLTFLLRSALTNFPPPNAVRSLSLRLGGLTGEIGKQLSLDRKGRLQRQLEEAIRQLKARYGYSPVYRCVDVEPWSVIPEQRQILVESDA
jgi:nucleotidyltransferase/DNA polymerase involved in DNA repair